MEMSILHGTRLKLRSADGNDIDAMFYDRRAGAGHAHGTPLGTKLVIVCEGNASFYEVTSGLTPIECGYSVLGWNRPGFGASTGTPSRDAERLVRTRWLAACCVAPCPTPTDGRFAAGGAGSGRVRDAPARVRAAAHPAVRLVDWRLLGLPGRCHVSRARYAMHPCVPRVSCPSSSFIVIAGVMKNATHHQHHYHHRR